MTKDPRASEAGCAPPRPPFALSVGITGHRSEMLGEHLGAVAARVDEAIEAVMRTAHDLFASNAAWFSEEPPVLTMVSPLADGADQIAAESALRHGYRLQVVLPFPEAQSRGELAEPARETFDRLIAKAQCRLVLPGDTAQPIDAYVMAGRGMVAHCDILIAVWDGNVPRGRGGTGEVVEWAMSRGTPIIHIPVDPDRAMALMWSAYDPAVITQHSTDIDRRPFDDEHVTRLLDLLLNPPPDADERRDVEMFLAERPRRIRTRLEYPLLLALTGIKRLRADVFQESRAAAMREADWRRFCEDCAKPQPVSVSLDLLGVTHDWADRLASHFAQTYRSGHIFNFVLAALAVLMGLSGFLVPHARLQLAFIDFILVLSIILNTRVGVDREWHRRWLDYRQLAERLRPLRSLKMVGIAAPDPPGSAANPIARRWIEWYAGAVWRAMACPNGHIQPADVSRIASSIAQHEIDPQVAYHRRTGMQIMTLDRRLEKASGAIFWVAMLTSIVTILALIFAPEILNPWSNWMTLLSAGLPAVGTAIFGIRFQGDFGGSAQRSTATAAALDEIDEGLKAPNITLSRAADLAEQAARAMFADLSQWQLVNQTHDLSISS